MLLPYAILLRLKSVLSSVSYTVLGSESPLYIAFMSLFYSSLLQSLFSIFLVFIQAIAINRIVIRNRISTEQSLVPGLVYILFSSMFIEYSILSPVLVSTTFIIIALSNLFQIYGKKATTTHTFNVGFMISMASLFYYPSILFLIIGILGFIMLRSIMLKGLLQILIGALFPYYIVFAYAFYYNDLTMFNSLYTDKFYWFNGFSSVFEAPYYLYGIAILLTVFSLFNYTNNIKAKSIQTQEKIDLLYLFLLLFLIAAFIVNNYSMVYLQFIFVPLSIFFTLWLLKLKSTILIEFIHFAFVIALISLHYIL